MELHTGLVIKSTEALSDTYFEGAIILITEYNAAGAVGFIINRSFPRRLNDLQEYKDGRPFPLYEGGPVDQEHLYFIHRCQEVISGSDTIKQDLCFGGSFEQVIKGIIDNTITAKGAKIFVGYCGWEAGELEGEITEGSWEIIETIDLFAEVH